MPEQLTTYSRRTTDDVMSSNRPASLRVVQVVESANAGVGRHTLDLCDGLLERGCDVHLVYSNRRVDRTFRDDLQKLLGHPLLTTVAMPMRREVHLSDLMFVRFVRRYLKTNGPFSVIHGHSSKAGAIARMAAVGLSTRAIYTPHAMRTMNPLIRSFSRFAIGNIEKGLSKVGDRVIALSPEERAHLIELGISEADIVLIPNGVDPVELPSKSAARSALGLAPDGLVVGFIGRLSEQKAADVLLSAFAMLLRDLPDVRLAMIGDGELGQQLRTQSDQLGISSNVHWLGHQPGFVSMPAFDVFVLPSRYEGLPYVLIESLVAGVPAVVTEKASSSLLVEDGVNGRVVLTESDKHLAEAMKELLSDGDKREQFRHACQQRATRFTRQAMVDQTLSLYQSLAAPIHR